MTDDPMVPAPMTPFAVQAGEGLPVRTPIGGTMVIKVDASRTNGSLSVIDLVVDPHQGPALHRHHREDELWVVLDGRFRFEAGDQLLEVSTGGMAFGPRGVAHCFQNIDDTPGRLLIVTTPGGLERFFRAFAREADPELLVDIGSAHGLEFLGPPPDLSGPL